MNALCMRLTRALFVSTMILLFATGATAGSLTGQEKAMMIEAARSDFYAQLARQIKGLNVSDNTLVANHATEDSTRSGSVNALVRGAIVNEPQFLEDVCLVSGSITLDQVVENLRATRQQFADGSTSGFESIKRYNEQKTILAQGVGTRRAQPGGAVEVASGALDDGLKASLAALKGSGQDKLGAIEAARIDALTQLARQIKGVRVSDESLLYNMALEGRWTETRSHALVQGARVVRYVPLEGDVVSCVMTISLQQVVENVQRQRTEFANGTVASFEKISRYNPGVIEISSTGYGAVGRGRLTPGVMPGRIIGTVR